MAGIRVIIVDDVQGVRQDLRTLLTLAGDMDTSSPVIVAGEGANGLEAVQLVQSLKPDVVLMDLEMPVMDGYEAARKIKKLSPAPRVIALTVHGYPEACRKASQAGIDELIVKGAPLGTILEAILRTNAPDPSIQTE
jgi:DNA-binding NarL/FixJ family response regulator